MKANVFSAAPASSLPASSLSASSRSSQSLRQLLGVVVGIVCLLAAIRVTEAETKKEDGSGGSDGEQISDMVEQGKGLHTRVERMANEGEEAGKAASDSKDLSASQCAQTALPVLRGNKRLADGSYAEMLSAAESKDKNGVSAELGKLVVLHERMSDTVGTLKQCSSNPTGSADGTTQIERQTTGTPNVQAGDNLSDLSSKSADTPSASPFFDTSKK